MLSIDLFATQFERELREGAVDDLEYRRMNDLREKMEMLMQAYKKADTDEVRNAIMKRYNEYKAEREGYMKVREQQVPSKQDAFAYVKPEPKGIGDVQDPRDKMAQLAQKSKKGPLANVGAGLKAFIKGEPEPMGEEQELGRRGIGMTNIKNLGLTASKGLARTIFQFPNIRYVVDEDDSDKMVDYYNALDSAGRTNFVYNVLGDGMKFLEVCRSLGIEPTPLAQQQPELPGIQVDPQGQLPLQEKKKFKDDDLEAGDVKVARELQKLRAQYPAAKSDVEAVARAEIDSTERSQQQLAAIRGANEKQDALLKQLVALDQEQGREISGLDKENDSLEQRLAQVQATNDRLQQAVGTMTGNKKATKTQKPVPQGSADLAQGGIIDVGGPVAGKDTNTSVDQPSPGQTVPGNLPKAPGLDPITKAADIFEPIQKKDKAAESKIKEHGGGIGPRQHWQSMMPEGQPQELIHRYLAIDAENDVDAVRAAIQAISRDPALSVTSKSRLLGQIGMIIKRHRLPIGRAYYQFMRQYMEDINETALNPKDLKGDYEAKRRALHDLSLNKDVDQAAVLQRRLDLDREAKAKGLAETVTNVKAGMAEIYRRLAPKIERHRDSFLAGQLYDELENYAELHGAEGEFKRMMSTARNSAHMEYDTNPGGFQNWFWFLPFEDDSMTEGTDDIKKKMSKLEALALAANRAGDDAKCKMYQQKIQSLKQKLSQSMSESLKPGEYHIHTVYFKDGTKKRIRVTGDEFDVVGYYKQRGQAVDRVDYDYQIHSDMSEQFATPGTTIPRKSVIQGYTVFFNPKTQVVSVTRGGVSEEAAIEQARVGTPSMKNFRQAADRLIDRIESDLNEAKEIVTKNDFLDRRDYLLRKIDADPNPVNKQIIRAEIRKLESQAETEGWITMQQRLVREDSNGGEAVEMAIMRRMLIAHTDLIVEFGLDKVVEAIEEVAYNVGDIDEIGSSDVSGWVRQVKQILGVDA